MQSTISNIILSATGAQAITKETVIQSLWSGYGQIVRLELRGGTHSSVILKHIKPPDTNSHPRGWNTGLSHQRKIRSYQVETHWYQHYAEYCANDCIVPACLAVSSFKGETALLLSDLNAAGFAVRKSRIELQEIYTCLDWLANFHATFLNADTGGLWESGTYWHLDTRPDELAALDDEELRLAAPLINQKLEQSRHQTLVHGDAKLENFCFGVDSSQNVAAVDFQYVGRGCGMKDVVYFIGSCLNENECESMESQLLDRYFSTLVKRVSQKNTNINTNELEAEWRDLYSVAWADFHRFIKGWSPDHWKINNYSARLTADVIKKLQP